MEELLGLPWFFNQPTPSHALTCHLSLLGSLQTFADRTAVSNVLPMKMLYSLHFLKDLFHIIIQLFPLLGSTVSTIHSGYSDDS
jgi:hypothetical protein